MIFVTQEEEIQLSAGIQAIYFYASWLPFHKKSLVMIDKIEKKHTNVSFLAIDTDHFKNQCKRFSIDSIPTVIIFKNGKEIKRLNGLVLTSAFKAAFSDICNN